MCLSLPQEKEKVERKSEIPDRWVHMNAFVRLPAFRWVQSMLGTKLAMATDLKSEPSVALVTGGAILGFNNEVHIDLDRAHTVLSPDEARRFAIRLEMIAATIEYVYCPASAIEASETELAGLRRERLCRRS